ncbi:hypothetical protein [Micromonospora sp. NPDC023956]|uniref:hypothetical protein n=1 Tax=Micromonospora sp. NPDC023956 TaxID=3155722 RepID=UPI0034057049
MQVSRDITTKGGSTAYAYQTANGFEGMCRGCGWNPSFVGFAPALVATQRHAQTCTS